MLLGMVFATLGAAVPAQTSRQAEADPPAQTQTAGELQDFGLVAASTGWVRLNDRLYWTVDDGGQWQDITPPLPAAAKLLSASFADPQTGRALWAGPNPDGSLALQLASTTDAGLSWTSDLVQVLASTDLDINIENASMDWLNQYAGWVSIKRQTGSNFSSGALFHSLDSGRSWIRSALPVGGSVRFIDELLGWTAGGPANNQLFKTTDGGLTWAEQPLPPGLQLGRVSHLYPPVFDSDQNGLLAAIVLEADVFQLRFYTSADAGQDWSLAESFTLNPQVSTVPLSLLDPRNWLAAVPNESRLLREEDGRSEALTNQDGLSAGIVDLRMLSPDLGWAKWNVSACTKTELAGSTGTTQVSCTASTKLIETGDAGVTWKSLLLPGIRATTMTQSSSAATTYMAQANTALAPNTQIFIGKGIDICSIPTLAQLDIWDDHSPYASINLYMGGAARALFCDNSPLNANFVAQAYAQGWTFIPTWVGPQAPCTNFLARFSSNANQAYLDGVNEANLAMNRLAELGFTTLSKGGSIVYYDLETFVGDQACRDAVKAFMNGWDYQLKWYGNMSGIYGSTGCTNGLNNFLSIDNKPDAIWAALWDDRATVWGLNCISDSVWASHQRIHQYAGAHNETYGGVTLNLDNNMLDGIVAIPNQPATTPPPSAAFLATPTVGTGPLAVTFYIVSTANITACAWDYGDGQTGTSCAATNTHVYGSSGAYSVTLTVAGPGGWDDQTRLNYIVVNEPTQPDLIPYPRGSSANPITIASITGTNANDTLYVNQPIFIDWAVKNIGTTNITQTFKADLYIDDQRILDYSFTGLGAGAVSGYDDISTTWTQSGWHTVRLVVDPDNSIAESNENNNTWSSQFYWEASVPIGPNIIAPTGVVDTNLPDFKWYAAPASMYVVSYKLFLNSLAPGVLMIEANIPTSVCVNSICKSSSHSPLPKYGDYEFKVGAVDRFGVVTYSPWTVFTYTNTPPTSPTNLSPTGTIQTARPTYSWTKSSYASWYELYVYPAASPTTPVVSDTSIQALSNCVGTLCTWTPAIMLDRGDYNVKVRAVNYAGASSFVEAGIYVNVDISRIFLPFVIR